MGRRKAWTVGQSSASRSGGRPPKLDAAAQQQLRDFLEEGVVNQYCDGICEGLREKTCG